jgi:hypothetical protein
MDARIKSGHDDNDETAKTKSAPEGALRKQCEGDVCRL